MCLLLSATANAFHDCIQPRSERRLPPQLRDSAKEGSAGAFPWVERWDEDEGAGKTCASNTIRESHNATVQHVLWDIAMPSP